jgi:CRISPR system Cascade subunit CasC
MIADRPEWNVEGACQVAHALSTHRVTVDFDYYTAVDDFRPGDNAGSDMIGTVQLDSACFYRYAVLDLDRLRKNLAGEPELTRRTVEAFVRASVLAIPTGKQNSTAAHNLPSYVLAIVGDAVPMSLANAFAQPIRPGREDLVTNSIEALETYLGQVERMYGTDGVRVRVACADRERRPATLIEGVRSIDEVVTRVAEAAMLEVA